MKILYGIQLNGNGHITRSVELISILKERGFDIDIVTSGNNSNLKIPFDVKNHFDGISIYYNKKGSINWIKTLLSVRLLKLIKDTKYDVSEYDLVISDFEPISAWSSKRRNVRSIGISIDSETFITKDRFVVAKNEVNYVSPAQFDQSYIILTRVSEIHNSSLIFDQIIVSYPENQLIVQATGVLVNLNPITNAPERIHDDYRKLVVDYEDYPVLQ
jgi:uncharacterized protein (TIGR00661 family)